jgi:uncharacterized protein (TIGR02271 family)
MTVDETDKRRWRGRDVVGWDGHRLGEIRDIYLDRETGDPEWALLLLAGSEGRTTFIPLGVAEPQGSAVRLPYETSTVESAPSVELGEEMSEREEERLYNHYGLVYVPLRHDDDGPGDFPSSESEGLNGSHPDRVNGPSADAAEPSTAARASSGLGGATGSDPGGASGGPRGAESAEVTRAEEELLVTKRQVERGRVRLRKHVVVEPETRRVPLRREIANVERVPVSEADLRLLPILADESYEVVLHEEQVVTEKRAVAKERVRVGTRTVVFEHEVSEHLRKEQIDVERDEDTGPSRSDHEAGSPQAARAEDDPGSASERSHDDARVR